MAMIAIAIPILPGKKGDWQRFIEQLQGSRKGAFKESRQRLGVRERTFLQQAPDMDLVIVTLEGDDPAAAFQRFAAGDDEFTRWFVQEVMNAHGLDLTQPPPGPLPELLIDSGAT